jgi:maltooligosyltrehalose synthase
MRVIHALRLLALGLAALALQGCLARAAVDVVTLPVRAVSKGVDVATTSQSEADEKRGRDIRKREERLGELERDYDKQMERCADGNDEACDKAQAIRAEMKAIMPGVPVEPDGN